VSRRQVLKWGAAAGITGTLGAMGALSALGIVRPPQEPTPEWEVAPGIVDYDLVPGPEAYDKSKTHVLKIAQWYDYWPGSFLANFRRYMQRTYGLTVRTEWDIFTSNEELFHLITLSKRRYDVMFPTNYMADLYKKVGMIYTLNEEWLPNTKNLDHELVNRPLERPWNRLSGPDSPLIGVPYFWGTTGIGFRTDRVSVEDIEEMGWEIFLYDEWKGEELRGNIRMLDEMGDVLTTGFKMAGWEGQRARGYVPMGKPQNPDPPYNGEFQWVSYETEPAKVQAAREWLFRVKPRLFDFNSIDVIPSLMTGTTYVTQAWNGDVVWAIRPELTVRPPVEYVVPKQGSTIWFDCVCVHNKSRNLWLAHEFMNFIHDVAENQRLTEWNRYATPNKVALETMRPLASGYRFIEDWRLYPNINRPEIMEVCDLTTYAEFDVLLNLYNPLWEDLVGG
jgi:spermidine/putrescine-binding protein